VPTSSQVIYLAAYSHPDEPVPVDMIKPLLLNFPISLSSTNNLYTLVVATSFSATKTSFKHNLLVNVFVIGFSIENNALDLQK
jgi:hypothetical protein